MKGKNFCKIGIFGIALLFLAFFSGCSGSFFLNSKEKDALVGRDPSWFPMQFGVYNANINAFLNSLVSEINEREGLRITMVTQDWVHLFENLDEGRTEAIFTSLKPSLEANSRYTFSEPFLLTGPVLVVAESSLHRDITTLRGKIIGVYKFDSSASVAQSIPEAVITDYKHIPVALESLCSGCYDALLVPVIEATSLVDSVYKGRLKIISKPLTDEGLRLIALKGAHDSLIDDFNSGLVKLRRQGKYDAIKKQYRLP